MFKGLPKLELPDSEEDQVYVSSTDSTKAIASDIGFSPSLPQLFLRENLMVWLQMSTFPKNILKF